MAAQGVKDETMSQNHRRVIEKYVVEIREDWQRQLHKSHEADTVLDELLRIFRLHPDVEVTTRGRVLTSLSIPSLEAWERIEKNLRIVISKFSTDKKFAADAVICNYSQHHTEMVSPPPVADNFPNPGNIGGIDERNIVVCQFFLTFDAENSVMKQDLHKFHIEVIERDKFLTSIGDSTLLQAAKEGGACDTQPKPNYCLSGSRRNMSAALSEIIDLVVSKQLMAFEPVTVSAKSKVGWLPDIGGWLSGGKSDAAKQSSKADEKYKFSTSSDLDIYVQQGDITLQKVDAVVSPTDRTLSLSGGASKYIADKSGTELVRECAKLIQQQGNLSVGKPVHTTAGKMCPPIRYVIHVVGPSSKSFEDPQKSGALLTEAFYNCLDYANRVLKISSVAVPAISSGAFGMPIQTVACRAFEGLMRFHDHLLLGTERRHLKEIVFINVDVHNASQMINVFRCLTVSTDIQYSTRSSFSDVTPETDKLFPRAALVSDGREKVSAAKGLDADDGVLLPAVDEQRSSERDDTFVDSSTKSEDQTSDDAEIDDRMPSSSDLHTEARDKVSTDGNREVDQKFSSDDNSVPADGEQSLSETSKGNGDAIKADERQLDGCEATHQSQERNTSSSHSENCGVTETKKDMILITVRQKGLSGLYRCIAVYCDASLQLAHRSDQGQLDDQALCMREDKIAHSVQLLVIRLLEQSRIPIISESIQSIIDHINSSSTDVHLLEILAVAYLMKTQIHLYEPDINGFRFLIKYPSLEYSSRSPVVLLASSDDFGRKSLQVLLIGGGNTAWSFNLNTQTFENCNEAVTEEDGKITFEHLINRYVMKTSNEDDPQEGSTVEATMDAMGSDNSQQPQQAESFTERFVEEFNVQPIKVYIDGRHFFRCVAIHGNINLQQAKRSDLGLIFDPNLSTGEDKLADQVKEDVFSLLHRHQQQIDELQGNILSQLDLTWNSSRHDSQKTFGERITAVVSRSSKSFYADTDILELLSVAYLKKTQLLIYQRVTGGYELMVRIPSSMYSARQPITLVYGSRSQNKMPQFEVLLPSDRSRQCYTGATADDHVDDSKSYKLSFHELLAKEAAAIRSSTGDRT